MLNLVGGHTEITHSLDRPIVIGVMLGEVAPDRLVSTGGARPGDLLLLTKGIAVEGTAIIAREKGDQLAGRVEPQLLARSADFLHRPGISVVRDAQIATAAVSGAVHAMHDPTEGGVATGLHELAAASGCGLEIDGAALPVLPETYALCEPFGLDPLGLIASGSLLLAVDPDAGDSILQALQREGIAATVIGRVLAAGEPVTLVKGDARHPLPTFAHDELTRLF